MRKITKIPSKKIAFKNVPITGTFFVKRSLFTKISIREAIQKSNNRSAYFDNDKIVRYIEKEYEKSADEIVLMKDIDDSIGVQDIVQIKKNSILGRVISATNEIFYVQYKENESIQFGTFKFDELKKIPK